MSDEGGADLCLLCYEKAPADCHRSMFARWWFEQTGEAVEELQFCTRPRKGRDAQGLQEPLF